MKKVLIEVLCLVSIAAISTVGYSATIVYDFGNPNANPPVLQAVPSPFSSYAVTHNGITLTAYGYSTSTTPNPLKALEWKHGGGDENGLGFTDTLDHEITLNSNNQPANYIQVDVSQALLAGGITGKIKAGSVTDGEAFDVWGSNTLGTLGTSLIPSGSTADNTYIPIPSWGTYKYIAMTVHPEDSGWWWDGFTMQPDCGTDKCYNDNVLLGAIEYCSVPEPVTLSLLAIGALTLLRRRK